MRRRASEQGRNASERRVGERFGRYTLLGKIATGGMAEVFAAELAGAAGFRKRVAIKRMRPSIAQEPESVLMFVEEARVGSQLSHPNICEVHELGRARGEFYIAMEYLHGVTLSTLVDACRRSNRQVPIRIAAALIAQACEGLHYAHELTDSHGTARGVIHRDVSPQNLFICQNGIVKLLDFGIAKAADREQKTQTGEFKGKAPYVSPEQCRAKSVDCRTDIWSLGVVLHETLTGVALFLRASLEQTLDAIANDPIPSLERLRPGAPAELDNVLSRALCREREWRFRSAADLRTALIDAMGADGIASVEEIAAFVNEVCGAALAQHAELFDRSVTSRDSEPGRAQSRAPVRRARDRKAAVVPLPLERSERPTAKANLRRKWQRSTESLLEPIPNLELPPAARQPAEPTTARKQLIISPQQCATTREVVPVPSPGDESVNGNVKKKLTPQRRRAGLYWTMLFGSLAGVAVGLLGAHLGVDSPARARGQATSNGLSQLPAWLTPIAAENRPSGEPAAGSSKRAAKKRRRTHRARRQRSGLIVTHLADTAHRDSSKNGRDMNQATGRASPALKPGVLFVDSDPYATIYVDEVRLGDTPVLGKKLAAGRHSVSAVTADGRTTTIEVDVRPGRVIRHRFRW